MALQECQDKHTSTELLIWMKWLDDKEQEVTRDQYYFAQIAAEVFRGNAEKPKLVELNQFVLPFKKEVKKVIDEFEEEEVIEKKGEESKSFWLGALGMAKDGKVIRNPLPTQKKK